MTIATTNEEKVYKHFNEKFVCLKDFEPDSPFLKYGYVYDLENLNLHTLFKAFENKKEIIEFRKNTFDKYKFKDDYKNNPIKITILKPFSRECEFCNKEDKTSYFIQVSDKSLERKENIICFHCFFYFMFYKDYIERIDRFRKETAILDFLFIDNEMFYRFVITLFNSRNSCLSNLGINNLLDIKKYAVYLDNAIKIVLESINSAELLDFFSKILDNSNNSEEVSSLIEDYISNKSGMFSIENNILLRNGINIFDIDSETTPKYDGMVFSTIRDPFSEDTFLIDDLLSIMPLLTTGQRKFISSVNEFYEKAKRISDRQREILESIHKGNRYKISSPKFNEYTKKDKA